MRSYVSGNMFNVTFPNSESRCLLTCLHNHTTVYMESSASRNITTKKYNNNYEMVTHYLLQFSLYLLDTVSTIIVILVVTVKLLLLKRNTN